MSDEKVYYIPVIRTKEAINIAWKYIKDDDDRDRLMMEMEEKSFAIPETEIPKMGGQCLRL